MTTLIDEIARIGESLRSRVTYGDKALLDQCIARYMELAARQQAGEMLDNQIAVVLATLENIRVGGQASVATEVRAVVTRYLASLTAALIA